MTSFVIALFGVRASGKSTLGHEIAEEFGFIEDSFAGPLKSMVEQAFAFGDDALYGPSSSRERQYLEYPFTGPCLVCGHPRFECLNMGQNMGQFLRCLGCAMVYPKFLNARIACQTLGTEWGRRLYRDVWAAAAFKRASGKLTVITDGRFENEVKYCRDRGAYTVLLLRNPNPVKRRWWQRNKTHPSEQTLEIDRSLFNEVFDNTNLSVEEAKLKIIDTAQRGITWCSHQPQAQEKP